MTKTNDWRETVTGETITDVQISDFSIEAAYAGDLDAVATCARALRCDQAARDAVAGWCQDAWAAEDAVACESCDMDDAMLTVGGRALCGSCAESKDATR